MISMRFLRNFLSVFDFIRYRQRQLFFTWADSQNKAWKLVYLQSSKFFWRLIIFLPGQNTFSIALHVHGRIEKEEAIFISNVIYRSIYMCMCAVQCMFYRVFSCMMCVLDTFRHFDCKTPPVVKTIIIITKHAYLHDWIIIDAVFRHFNKQNICTAKRSKREGDNDTRMHVV